MLVLLKQIERIVDFVEQGKVETSEINAQLKLVNCDDLIQQAKDIDKEDYSEDCFGISFNSASTTTAKVPSLPTISFTGTVCIPL